jgi:hypothetical protein
MSAFASTFLLICTFFMLKLSLSLTALSLSCLASLRAGPVYDIQLVARSGTVIDGKQLGYIGFHSALNDRGDIVFTAALENGMALLDRNGLLVQPGQVIGGRTIEWVYSTSINNHGDVVFDASVDGIAGVFSLTDMIAGPGTVIANETLVGAFSPVINDNGLVAFYGGLGLRDAVFTQHAIVASPDLTVNGITVAVRDVFGYDPIALNNAGQVAFKALNREERFSAVFVGNQVVAHTGQVISGLTLNDVYTPAINDRGDIIFSAFSNDLPFVGIFTPSRFQSLGLLSGFNNNGGTAFEIFGHVYTTEGRVVGRGSVAQGLHIDFATPYDINNLGQVLFRAELAEGGSALFLATPTPEPATCILVGFGLIVAASAKINAQKRRRHRHDGRSRT